MKTLCPNWDREDGLDTVLEVPIPEPDEIFLSSGNSKTIKSWRTNMKTWLRSYVDRHVPYYLDREDDLHLMLGVIGAPLAPIPVEDYRTISSCDVKEGPLVESMAKYILRQYIAAVGGEKALSSMKSMYAMGKVMMRSSSGKGSKVNFGGGEMGGFVLWKKKPEMWCMELVVAGCKISAGSDGKVTWRQTPWQQHSHAFRGPPRPLRRFLQGLDPISTATLFSHAACIGEKSIKGDDCFVLQLDASPAALRGRGSRTAAVVRHTLCGCFSQRTGLLVQIEDSNVLRIKDADDGAAYWETSTESFVDGYRVVDGVQVAHSGRTTVSLARSGEKGEGRTRSVVEETWNIEEVEFNVMGLSLECFLAPGDLEEEEEEEEMEIEEGCDVALKSARPPLRFHAGCGVRIGPSQVAAVDDTDV